MYFKRHKSGICYLFIILLLIYGTCFGAAMTDSFFSCANTLSTPREEGNINHFDASLPLEQIYVSRLLKQCETALTSRHTLRRIKVRISQNGGFPFSLACFFPCSFSDNSSADTSCFFREIISNTIIMGYIHRQDGEKPCSPISIGR